MLAEKFPPQFTSCSKYYESKMIWFQEEIFKLGINILNIDTVKKLGYMFTKGLLRVTFEYLRNKL